MQIDHQCARCKHFHKKDFSGNKCDAFLAGIPKKIINNEFIHTRKYPGQDNNILYEED